MYGVLSASMKTRSKGPSRDCHGLEGRPEADLDLVPVGPLVEILPGDACVVGVDLAGHEPPVVGESGGHHLGAEAGEATDLQDAAGSQGPDEHLQHAALDRAGQHHAVVPLGGVPGELGEVGRQRRCARTAYSSISWGTRVSIGFSCNGPRAIVSEPPRTSRCSPAPAEAMLELPWLLQARGGLVG